MCVCLIKWKYSHEIRLGDLLCSAETVRKARKSSNETISMCISYTYNKYTYDIYIYNTYIIYYNIKLQYIIQICITDLLFIIMH